ncbi:MAG: S-methyl-5'-thioadenosine phosphorylase [Deltaproteobacteria bacterium]|nr:S-methyl-5'-thioadenosine phosphorylase [Deltaproteobacteria bacterium]
MSQYIGIIGGSGLYDMEEFQLEEERQIETPFGMPSDPLRIGKLAGVPVVFLARHGAGHRYSPSEINYRANIWAFKKVGVKAIFSVSAVGSLRQEIVPGHMVIVDQFIDRTRERPSTFFEKGIVGHVSLAHPVSGYLRKILIAACQKIGAECHQKGTYVCMEGPQFSTIAESNFYRQLGADVIGMTNLQEAKLAREAEIDYATLALSTDYDCWHPEHDHVTTEQVIATLNKNIANAQKILVSAVQAFDFDQKLESEGVLKSAVMTKRELISKDVIQRLEPIIGKYFKD